MNEIEVSNLWKAYGRGAKRIKAVNGVSFSVKAGEIKGLVGASGSGKTTVLNAILSLIKPDRGAANLMRPVGYVSQDPFAALPHYYTVVKCIAEPLLFGGDKALRKNIGDRVNTILKLVSLDPYEYGTKIPSQLSGGERQRVLIARALVTKPKTIILDEPTSMIDEAMKDDIIKIITDFSKTMKLAVLLVTHDLKMAASVCDQLMVMKEGVIVEQGPCDMIIAEPQGDYTRALVKAAFDLPAYWAERCQSAPH
jgi:peptide/nickel transport system ATP-binding protein